MDMAPTKKAFRIYNRRTRRIIKTIHVDFDELTAMASERNSSGPALHEMTPVSIKHQKSLLPILKQLHPEQAFEPKIYKEALTQAFELKQMFMEFVVMWKLVCQEHRLYSQVGDP
ncbi:hypothetical protein Tco_0271352 [Tanacetum coccineum]